MDRILKLVYNNWIGDTPIANGVPPVLAAYLQQGDTARASLLMDSNMFAFRDHNNFRLYYKKHYPNNIDVDVNGILDDDSIYLFPVEIRTDLLSLTRVHKFTLDGVEHSYTLKDTIDPALISYINQGKVKILINFIHDPINDISDLENIENYFENNNIKPSSVVIVSGNSFKSYTGLVTICRGNLFEQQAAEKMMAYPHMSVLGYVSDNVKPQDLDVDLTRPNRFLSFNRQMNHRSHRLVLAYLALKHGLLHNSFFSFVGNIDISDLTYQLTELYPDSALDNLFEEIHKLIPYEIDTQHLSQDKKTEFSTNNNRKDLYENSYVHITSETGFSSNDVFFSEKTFRPITNLQPFIVFGNYGCLKELQDIGFKTFHPYINESYDLEYDSVQRIKLLEIELKRLAAMPLDQLHQLYYAMTDILIYNQEHLKTFKDTNPYAGAIKEIQNLYN